MESFRKPEHGNPDDIAKAAAMAEEIMTIPRGSPQAKIQRRPTRRSLSLFGSYSSH